MTGYSIFRLLPLAVVLTISGCASTHVLRDFSTDGCSLFPDGDSAQPTLWCDCCVAHDQSYWRGGTAVEREAADAALRGCVLARTGRETLAAQMYRGVRLGGTPWMPAGFRWCYGWGYGRGYEPLTPVEQAQAVERLIAYERDHPQSFCQSK